MKLKSIPLLLLLPALMLLVACGGGSQSADTPTPIATQVPSMATPTPVAKAVATPTPSPTATFTPVPPVFNTPVPDAAAVPTYTPTQPPTPTPVPTATLPATGQIQVPKLVDLSDVSILCELNEQSKVASCRISHDINAKQMKWSSNVSDQWSSGRDFAVTIENQMEAVEIQLELCVANDCRTLKKAVELPAGFSGKSRAVSSAMETPAKGNMPKNSSQNKEGPPPALIKSLGYDFSTGVVPILITDYGTLAHVDIKRPEYNLQPTFVLPAGTKVTAIIDGVVCMIPKLYSGDYSVMMAPSCEEKKYMWEMEHVINVTVEVGDRVMAGQPVAEVSNYSYEYGDPQGLDLSRPDRKYGFDLVEIGLLEGGNAPVHHCPWLYIDPNYKEELLGMMTEARKSIETETTGTPNSEYIDHFLEQHITDWETPDGKPLYNTSDYQARSCKFTNIIGEDGMPIPD